MSGNRESAVRAELHINPFGGTSSLEFFDAGGKRVAVARFWDNELETAWLTAEQSINERMTEVKIFDRGRKFVCGGEVTFGAEQFENHRRTRNIKLPWPV